ncbi:MAG: hypothetical protein WBV06_01950, partial [Acidimicrobiia bacterium]
RLMERRLMERRVMVRCFLVRCFLVWRFVVRCLVERRSLGVTRMAMTMKGLALRLRSAGVEGVTD